MGKTPDYTKRAISKYDAENTNRIQLKLNKKTDADILEKFDSVGNKQGYIKTLIRDDIQEEKGSSISTEESYKPD